jgi:hypothetical protein
MRDGAASAGVAQVRGAKCRPRLARPDKVPIAGREERLDLIGATATKGIAKRRIM